jgi:hypothetical protein
MSRRIVGLLGTGAEGHAFSIILQWLGKGDAPGPENRALRDVALANSSDGRLPSDALIKHLAVIIKIGRDS